MSDTLAGVSTERVIQLRDLAYRDFVALRDKMRDDGRAGREASYAYLRALEIAVGSFYAPAEVQIWRAYVLGFLKVEFEIDALRARAMFGGPGNDGR